jgi:hypothetical protein
MNKWRKFLRGNLIFLVIVIVLASGMAVLGALATAVVWWITTPFLSDFVKGIVPLGAFVYALSILVSFAEDVEGR